MKISKSSSFLMGISCLMSILLLKFQEKNFSGNWMLVSQESVAGILYSNGVPQVMDVNQQQDQIIIKKTTSGENGKNSNSVDTLYTDGKAFQTKTRTNRKKSITLQWNQQRNGFTTTSIVYSSENSDQPYLTTMDNWSIINEQLILVRKVTNSENGEEWESKATYEKE